MISLSFARGKAIPSFTGSKNEGNVKQNFSSPMMDMLLHQHSTQGHGQGRGGAVGEEYIFSIINLRDLYWLFVNIA